MLNRTQPGVTCDLLFGQLETLCGTQPAQSFIVATEEKKSDISTFLKLLLSPEEHGGCLWGSFSLEAAFCPSHMEAMATRAGLADSADDGSFSLRISSSLAALHPQQLPD